jgi:hypothetical protein
MNQYDHITPTKLEKNDKKEPAEAINVKTAATVVVDLEIMDQARRRFTLIPIQN